MSLNDSIFSTGKVHAHLVSNNSSSSNAHLVSSNIRWLGSNPCIAANSYEVVAVDCLYPVFHIVGIYLKSTLISKDN